MNKKYLSVILFGALMLGATGTFTSCKDYDDDITNLQTQIDKQNDSLNKTLSEKLAAVESSISSLQSAQSSLDSKIAAAEDAAEKAALEAQKQAIETAKTELNTVKAELQAAIQANTGEIADVKAAVAGIDEEIESLQAAQKSLESEIAAAKDAAEKAVLEAKKEAIETAKTELNTVKAELQAAIAANQAAIQSNKDEIAGVKAAVTSIEGDIESLQAAQDSLKNEIAAVNDAAKKAALEAQNAAIEAAKAELTAMKAELQAGIDANKEAISVVNAAVTALQTSVEKQMSEIVGRIEALEAFQTTTEEALANLVKADETLTGSIEKLDADLAELGQRMTAVEAQIAALQSYKADIDANKEGVAANKEAIDKLVTDLVALEAGELTDEMIQAIAIRVEDIVGGVRSQLEVITVALKKQVTHVSLYKRANAMVEEKELTLDLVSAEAVRTWTFGEGLEGAISFTKGNKETFEDSFVIRVSPTTATLDKYMIRLVNSQMEDLSNLLEIKSIEPYTDLLVATRTISQNGLWKVTVKLKDNYDTDAYHDAAAIYEEDENGDEKVKADILYAVMVSGEEHDGREVVSEYGLTLAQLNKGTKHELFFNVDETSVKEIKNRWDGTEPFSSENGTNNVSYEELAWDMTPDGGNYKYAPWAEPITTGNGKNVQNDDTDARQTKPAYSVVAGKPFTVNFDEETAKNIRGFYVTLDVDCAVESEPSEINAWRSYHVKGLNTVTSGSSLELTIPEDVNADGDYIGFRVYAVNYDGSLVDPDGKAFYVYVGVPAENWNAVNTVIIPDANSSNNVTDEKSASQAVTLTKLTGAVKATWVTDKIGTNEHVFDAVFEGISFTTTSLSTTASSISSVDFSKVVKIHTVPTINDWTKYVDNKAYNGTLTIYDVHGSVLATINITMTKQLPTAPEGFSVKTNQLDASGIYNCYLIPDNWAAQQATNGTMDMDYVFNWGAGVPAQYVISFAKAEKDGGKDVANDVNGGDILTVAKDYIDNKTQHATVVSYNFGKISSETKDEDGNFADYKVEVKTFPTVFNCIYNDTYTWSWDNKAANAIATNTKLVYGTNYTFKNNSGSEYSFIQAIKGTSSKDGKYSRLLSDPYEESLTLKPGEEAHLISKANGAVDEYFKVDTSGDTFKFIASTVSDDTNPTAAVPSTLKLVYVDMYGHDVVIELDMTVVPR